MDFQLSQARPVLESTPAVLRSLLQGLPAEWTSGNEGPNTWSPFDVVGHLIHVRLTTDDLARRGRHPEFGVVTMSQLLSTWVAHDLSHINQIVRVMAKQYGAAVGPWRAYLSLLK